MDASTEDLLLQEDRSNEDIAGIKLSRYKEEIRTKYLEKRCTQNQILEWLNTTDDPYVIKNTQLIRQLNKWNYFKNRSRHLKRQRTYRIPPEVTLKMTTSSHDPSTGLPQDSDDRVLDNDEESELEDLLETLSLLAIPSKREPTLSVSSGEIATAGCCTRSDPPLAASVTSSQLTGLHSFRSLQKRLQHSQEEKVQFVYNSGSASPNPLDSQGLYSQYDEQYAFAAFFNDLSSNPGYVDDHQYDFLPDFNQQHPPSNRS